MIASIIIIAAASVLFLYWFRYTCLLMLGQKREAEAEAYTLKVTSTIRLSFPNLQQALMADSEPGSLDALHDGLDKDYKILTDLLQQFVGAESIEHRILLIDYRIMQKYYAATRRFESATHARQALTEMSHILGYFASEIGASAAL